MATFIRKPDTRTKLDILTASACFDICLSSCSTNQRGGVGRIRSPEDPFRRWIYPAHIPGSGEVGILKVLQTNVCKNHCTYCSFSSDRDGVMRTGFTPDELAKAFIQLVYKTKVHGIFISSGVGVRADTTMEKMIQTAEILRNTYHFGGYIHLKILPGASYHLIESAARYANRLSVNLEAPGKDHLKLIAPDKDMRSDLITPMKWTGDIIKSGAGANSQTTQFVVGASDETDCDILKTVDWIYRELFVFRAYFSSYQPVDNETAISIPETALLREHRLYQCDFLLRAYGFRLNDLVFTRDGNIPLDVDPKTAYAAMHPELFPVDINHADKQHLLRVPGIGPLSAQRIIAQRRSAPFHQVEELKTAGVITGSASPYIVFSGKRDTLSAYRQPWLFEENTDTGWVTGIDPYQKEKIVCQSDNNKSLFHEYEYPAIKGKSVIYCGKRK
jgi:predicted DNA-binding helix-hairpin-helix protein